MINKLQKRIFLLVFIPISIFIIVIITTLTFSSCNKLIQFSSFMLDRFSTGIDNSSQELDELYIIKILGNNYIIEYEKTLDEKIINKINKIVLKNKENGIVGNYIYNIRKDFKNNNAYNIVLIKNEELVTQIKYIKMLMGIIMFCSIICLYYGAKFISKLLIKPIQDTFDKQKQFISDASHELKTPLSVIKANTDVLEIELPNNKWINYIQNEVESMNRLVNELLLLAKSENINNMKEIESVNLSEEIKNISAMFESLAYEKNVEIINDIEENIDYHCNKEDIEHILSTLVDNAIKHSTEKVFIEMKKHKNEIQINVKNIGEEIPVEDREKIFERFYRLDKSRNRNSKRYGLGLAIAKANVEKYKGNIKVNCKDGITTFLVKLPINIVDM